MAHTEVVAAHLCIEFELCKGVTVATGSFQEPVTDWLIREALSFTATDEDDAVRVAS